MSNPTRNEPLLLDLEQDLPTTPEDVEALRRAHRQSATLSPEEYRRLLKQLGPPQRDRCGHAGVRAANPSSFESLQGL